MSAIEKELTAATKVKSHDYEDRQDYLAALLRYMSDDKKFKDDDYDKLTDGVITWFDAAVKAMDTKQRIPEFPDKEDADESDIHEATEDERVSEGREHEGTDPAEQDNPPATRNTTSGKRTHKYKASKTPTEYDNLSGAKNRFGVVEGTRSAEVVKLLTEGTTMAAINEKVGGRYYNLIKRLVEDGHMVEKHDGNVWKLIHKDDVSK